MSAELLDGKLLAKQIQSETKKSVRDFTVQHGLTPTLAAVLVGDDAASQVYVRNKERACQRVGIDSQLHRLPEASTTAEVLAKVNSLNADNKVHGILVQLPLPPAVDTRQILDAVAVNKDVDAFHPYNVGLISQGRPQFLPCTPHGIVQMLARHGVKTTGKHVVVLGRSDIVGKPMVMMLSQKDSSLGSDFANATVTMCHSRTQNLAEITSSADILIAAIGQPKFVTPDMVKNGATVIDVGINRTDEGLVGDVDFDALLPIAARITPVPGGVGPLTVTMLLENTLKAAKLQIESSVLTESEARS